MRLRYNFVTFERPIRGAARCVIGCVEKLVSRIGPRLIEANINDLFDSFPEGTRLAWDTGAREEVCRPKPNE
jgi:hypothetical protein